jgi:hypothetical protein
MRRQPKAAASLVRQAFLLECLTLAYMVIEGRRGDGSFALARSAMGQLLPTETRWRAAQAKGLGSPPVAVVTRADIGNMSPNSDLRDRPSRSHFAPSTPVTDPGWERTRAPLPVIRAPGASAFSRGSARSRTSQTAIPRLVSRGSLAQQPAEGCTTPATPLRWNVAACF